jgi:Icc protein
VSAIEVLQLSDIHLHGGSGDLYGRDPEITLSLVLDDVAARGLVPDMIVVTGDLVHDGAPDGYRRLATALATVGAPVYCLAGNHDRSSPLETNLPRPGIHCERAVQVGGWLFVFLDSNAHGRLARPSGYVEDKPNRFVSAVVGDVSGADLDWLDRMLAGTPADHVMAWVHHPPVAPGAWPALAPRAYADPLFKVLGRTGRVRAVAAGHVHAAYEGQRDGIRVFACPSTWLAMDFDTMTMAPPGYRWYRLHPSGRIEAAAFFVDDERFASPDPLPPWAVAAIAGEFDHTRLEHLSQEEIIASLGGRGH